MMHQSSYDQQLVRCTYSQISATAIVRPNWQPGQELSSLQFGQICVFDHLEVNLYIIMITITIVIVIWPITTTTTTTNNNNNNDNSSNSSSTGYYYYYYFHLYNASDYKISLCVCQRVSEFVTHNEIPSISRERLKLETSNLVNGLATGNPNEKMKN